MGKDKIVHGLDLSLGETKIYYLKTSINSILQKIHNILTTTVDEKVIK